MAENKKSFILYCDLIHTVRKMPKDKAGELFLTILSYVNDESPEPDDIIVQLTFEPVKQQLKRDLLIWEGERVNRVIAGHLGGIKSGEARRLKAKQNEANKAGALKTKQTQANEAVNVTVNVNDNVNDNVINNQKGLMETFHNECLHQQRWQENICLTVGNLELKEIPEKLKVFNAHCIAGDEPITTMRDYKRHFRNWLLNKGTIEKKNTPLAHRTPKILKFD